MNTTFAVEGATEDEVAVDAVQEMRLRVWARQNYTPADQRNSGWHPIILEEMERKDRES